MGRAIFIGEQRSGPLDAGTPACGTAGASERAAGGGAVEGEGARRHAASPSAACPSSVLRVSWAQRRCPCHRDRGLRAWVGVWVEEGAGQRGVQTSASLRMSERAAAAGSRICIPR